MALDSGGGGSTTSICVPTPFDQQQTIDNILARLTNIEQILSQLLGVDITTIQLSDITQNAGNLTGLNLASGVLGQLFYSIGRSNVFAFSLEDPFITTGDISSQNTGLFTDSLHNAQYLRTGTSTGSFAGFQAKGQGLRYLPQYFHGGFYFKTRLSLGQDGRTPTADPDPEATMTRVFIGLHSNTFVGPGPTYNQDDPGKLSGDIFSDTSSSVYIAFQLSPNPATRSDVTWKIIVRDEPVYVLFHQYSQRVIDTGVVAEFNTYYDFEMRCDPGSQLVNWKITRCLGGVSAGGGFQIPNIYDPNGSTINDHVPVAYSAGIGIWKLSTSDPGQWKTIYVHDFWSQSLDMDTP